MTPFRLCAVIPTYDNPATIRRVVVGVRAHRVTDVIVVDDGSGPSGRAEVEALAAEGLAVAVHREQNGGKGAAVKSGLSRAHELGFTHALQIDADGQHELGDIPAFVDRARARPEALILGKPVFDESAPRGRTIGRKITLFWTHLETGGEVIGDPMCGFRIYPVAAALATHTRSDAMDFDPEIAVRMVWAGVPVENLPTKVRYIGRDEGGVSHFRLFRDNVLISWMHSRLMMWKIFASIFRRELSPRALPG
jgi:glycosyltransferase involved in cell wall biosynthesis